MTRLGSEIVTDSAPGAWEHQPLTTRMSCTPTASGILSCECSGVDRGQFGDGVFLQVPSSSGARHDSCMLPTVFERLSGSSGGASSCRSSSSEQLSGQLQQQHPQSHPYSSFSTPRGSVTPSSAFGGLTPGPKSPSKLGPGHVGSSGPVGQAWLGIGPVSEEVEVEEAAAAVAEQQYYEQLHVIAAEQAQLHGQLRDTYVLKAYKGTLVVNRQSKRHTRPCTAQIVWHWSSPRKISSSAQPA